MSYLVTARKWRPQKFSEIVGQNHISATLKNAIEKNRIAHAYIFAGPRGVGKTTTARIFAKRLNCLDPDGGEPCNACSMCKAFQKFQSLDVIEIDGASNRRIEEIRQLRETVKYAPTSGQYKVYIIDEVHMLTTESFNALLKTLEEPPEQTIFIFATTDIQKVPLTIISRCQRFDFRRIEVVEIKQHIAKIAEAEKIEIDDQSLTIIAKKADGALRDAQSIFDQVISYCGDKINAEVISEMLNLIDEEIFFRVSDAIITKDFASGFTIVQLIYDNGWNFIDFIQGLIEHFRNIMTVVMRKDAELVEWAEVFKERYLNYKKEFSEGDLLRIQAYLQKTMTELKVSSNQKILMEIALCHLIGLEKSATISEIISQIEKLQDDEAPRIEPLKKDNPETGQKKKSESIPPAYPESQFENTAPVRKEKTTELNGDRNASQIISFKFLNQKWEEFVSSIYSEKFTIAGLLSKCKLGGITGTKVELYIEDPDDELILKEAESLLSQKSKEIFGTKLSFEFSHSEDKFDSLPKASDTAMNSNNDIPDTPLVRAVKDILGGKEIRR